LGVFERFTERARQAVVVAQEEARELRHSHIGSEHLLLALLRDDKCLAACACEAARDAPLVPRSWRSRCWRTASGLSPAAMWSGC
jgi:ATP-dependent Clp protease ATP-binding subunit ClpA